MKTRVLDSWAIMEWISGREPVLAYVSGLLERAEKDETRLFMSAINVGEVYYFLHKSQTQFLAEEWRKSYLSLPVKVEVPGIDEIWSAAQLKGRFPISYADAFAASLAQKYACPLVTGDPEFRGVADLKLDWIGRNPS